MRINFTIFFIIVFSFGAISQEIELAEISVIEANQILPIPFAGGLRAPQFNVLDINLDGLEDIVVFDRDGKVFIPLIRKENGDLSYAPEFRSILPKVASWVLFRDFNNDGIKDIFCSPVNVGIPGIEVYKGIVEDDILRYEIVTFPERDFDILYFPIGSTVTQVYVSVVDIPDIRDLDGDGDLDVVAFEPSGSTIYFYRNEALERGFTLDTMIYVLHESCYGGMVESGFSQEVSLSPEPGVCASNLWSPDELFAETRHSGSTVLSMDITGDNLQELILGDISYDGLVALTNTGTLEQAHLTDQNVRFPEGMDPAVLQLFLTGFHEDVDQDGEKELVVAANDRFGSQTRDNILLYDIDRIEGENSAFNLIERNFLTDQMIYPGPLTAPLFHDFNNDGLTDLLIGTEGRSIDGVDVNPALVLYTNEGSLNEPSFVLSDSDYLDMSAFKTTSRSFVPAIGDLDGDGDLDLIIGDNVGRLYYLENTSSSTGVFSFDVPVYPAFDIKVSSFAVPSIYDFDNDGLGDLIIGEQNFNSQLGKRGSLNYFQNLGSVGAPNFETDVNVSPNDPIFGRVNLKEPGFISNNSAPTLVNLGEEVMIATGSASGHISLYETSKSEPQDSFDIRATAYGGIREGEQSVLSFADLDDDDFLEVAVGTRRGGLTIYHTDIKLDFDSPTGEKIFSEKLKLWPNPSTDILQIELPENLQKESLSFKIYRTDGSIVLSGRFTEKMVNVSSLETGLYFIDISTKSVLLTGKFVQIQR